MCVLNPPLCTYYHPGLVEINVKPFTAFYISILVEQRIFGGKGPKLSFP